MDAFDPRSSRMRRARIGSYIGKTGYGVLVGAALLCAAGGVALLLLHQRYGFSLLGASIVFWLPALWWKYDLSVVSPAAGSKNLNDRLSLQALHRLTSTVPYSPQSLWEALQTDWQSYFFTNHLLLHSDLIPPLLSPDPAQLVPVWQDAMRRADAADSKTVEVGHLVAALLQTSPSIPKFLNHFKKTPADVEAVAAWLDRDLEAMHRPRPSFGGIGRDWASGFTPKLNQFGHNLSLEIEHYGANFGTLAESRGVINIKSAFSKGASAIALVGPEGIGKTSHAYALAQNLLAESRDPLLSHRQIIGLNPSAIISAAAHPGELEYVVSTLMSEAAHAGNIILFMDDAELFFTSGPGAFDVTRILLPIIQARAVQFVLAMGPHDYQHIKSTNPAFAGLLTPVVLSEPDETGTLAILADNATTMEIRHKVMISYDALKETYRLSGRYEADMAYPGKAIRLLEQALTHVDGSIVTEASVQAAIEQATGVKAGTAAPIEAEELLNLEDKIHERMINQTRAVSVVANALRRARAGVSSPNRPIGSFLFLGPTGVGKTELAKSIAATYFGAETSMIRMDMSEYQQESDVSRLLSGGQGEASSLILKVRERPFSVVLLDEIEKAHPNILNLLLQLLDEGQLTDSTGRTVSFKDTIVIATSNAGADTIRGRIERGEQLESFEREFTDELINSGQFRPELLNRFDEIVLFRPLNEAELSQVVRLMLGDINKTLASQNLVVELTDAGVAKIVAVGNDPRLGARPMRRALQRAVEDTVAQKILRQEVHPGDHITLDADDLSL